MSTLYLVYLFHLYSTIFHLYHYIQRRVRSIPGVINAYAVFYGATPLSSIRGTVYLMVSGPYCQLLYRIAYDLQDRLQKVGGLNGF